MNPCGLMSRYNDDGNFKGKYFKNGEYWEYTPREFNFVSEYVQFDDDERYHGYRISMKTGKFPKRVDVYEHGEKNTHQLTSNGVKRNIT